jgi:putative tryptophan/tyrosine transport system substrate-binding protein
MQRRAVLMLGAAGVALPRWIFAQTSNRVFRIAILDDAADGARNQTWPAFRKHLAELGLVEGKNVVLNVRYAGGVSEGLNSLAAEIVAAKPDLIVTPGTPTTRAVLRATSDIPVIFVGAADPAGAGLVVSLAKPGGNVTGVSIMATETSQKTLELLHELLPGADRIAFLTDTANQAAAAAYSRLEEKARNQKLSIRLLDGIGHTALERSFATLRRDRVQGLLVGFPGTLLDGKDEIIQFAAREKLPVVYGRREYVLAGGLMSFDVDRAYGLGRAAILAQKILGGGKPADIPVEQIHKTRLDINMQTARALGLKIPDAIRLRADELIE